MGNVEAGIVGGSNCDGTADLVSGACFLRISGNGISQVKKLVVK